MKKIILLVILFLAVLGIVLILARRGAAPKPTPPFSTSVSPPVVPSLAAEGPTYTLAIPAPAFPAAVPVYAVGLASAFQTQFSVVAKALGFTGEPRVVVGSRGSFSLWTKDAASLTIGGDPLEIAYASGAKPTTPVTLASSNLEPAATQLLQKLALSSPELTLMRESVSYFAPSGSVLNRLSNSSGATLVQLNYRYLLAERQLFTRRVGQTVAAVAFNASGEVVSLAGYWFPAVSKLDKTLAVVDYPTATSRLQNNLGILVSLSSDADFNTEAVPQYVVLTSSISDVSLGYYYSPGAQTLAPVYIFSGTGVDSATGKTVKTTTVVSALP